MSDDSKEIFERYILIKEAKAHPSQGSNMNAQSTIIANKSKTKLGGSENAGAPEAHNVKGSASKTDSHSLELLNYRYRVSLYKSGYIDLKEFLNSKDFELIDDNFQIQGKLFNPDDDFKMARVEIPMNINTAITLYKFEDNKDIKELYRKTALTLVNFLNNPENWESVYQTSGAVLDASGKLDPEEGTTTELKKRSDQYDIYKPRLDELIELLQNNQDKFEYKTLELPRVSTTVVKVDKHGKQTKGTYATGQARRGFTMGRYGQKGLSK